METSIANKLIPIKTKRLILKITSTNDIDLILKLDKQFITQKHLGGIKDKTKEERLSFLHNKEENFNNGSLIPLTVSLLNQTKIGFIELKLENKKATISYIFDEEYINNGYCTEACRKIIDICFNIMDIYSIYASTKEDNESSKKVLKKLGFNYINKTTDKTATFLNYQINKP